VITLFAGILLGAFFIYQQINSVTYLKEKVTIDNINSDETVLIMTFQNHSERDQDEILIINKNKQAKYLDLSLGVVPINKYKVITEAKLLSYCDKILQDKKIAYEKEKLEISNEMLNNIININYYNLGEIKYHSCDFGQRIYYSVCGSGKKRQLIRMKVDGDGKAQCDNRKINKLCNDIAILYANAENKHNKSGFPVH